MSEAISTPCCPPADPAPPVPTDEAEANAHLARLAKALGHPDIVDALPLAQSTVSQHLKTLKEAGLIRGDVDGPRVCYCVEPGAVALLKTLVDSL